MNKNSKILITGANGFLGKHVCSLFRNSGYTNLFIPPSITLDLRDNNQVISYFEKNIPEHVIHLAGAVGGIGLNDKQPGDLTVANLQMGLNIIEASRFYNVRKILMVGTVCSYASNCPIPFQEEDFIEFNRSGPGMPEITNSGYGLAKRMLYEVLRNYRKQYGLKFAYLIPVNMLGQFDNFHPNTSHVIPAMIKKFIEAKGNKSPVTLWGTGMPTREFVYAGDVARAILTAFESYDGDVPINIGTGKEINIKDLALKIADLVKFKGLILWDTSQPDGQLRRCLDVSKAKNLLGFEATTTLDEALEKTVQWYAQTQLTETRKVKSL